MVIGAKVTGVNYHRQTKLLNNPGANRSRSFALYTMEVSACILQQIKVAMRDMVNTEPVAAKYRIHTVSMVRNMQRSRKATVYQALVEIVDKIKYYRRRK